MKKILVIENDPSVKAGTVKLLIEDGYNVINAGNVEEGISHAKEHLPDLIITNLLMPDIEGYTIFGELQNPFQIFFRKD